VDAETLEAERIRDLSRLERLDDEGFCTELYRALANTRWTRRDEGSGAVSMSWSRAEELVNRLREEREQPSLTLAQTGGEGTVSDDVAGELERLGWDWQLLNTGSHDERHIERPESPPPPGGGEAPRVGGG
jgi:hypothetical protein